MLIASGLGVAIALVMTVNGVSNGIRNAQDQVLSGLYGVGTDLTVSKPAVFGQGGPQNFDFGGTAGSTSGSTRKIATSRLLLDRGSSTLTSAEQLDVASTTGVSKTVGVLQLRNMSFTGSLPTFMTHITQNFPQGGTGNGMPGGPGFGTAPTTNSTTTTGPPTGGFDGKGGSQFGIDTFTIDGVSAGNLAAGPLSSTKVATGRTLTSADAGKNVVVLDAAYATSAKLSTGKKITIGGKDFAIIGTLKSTSASSTTAVNAYIPLDVAQKLSGHSGEVTTMYLKATSNSEIAAVKSALSKNVSGITVNSSADLASTVSGSISSASTMVNNLGGWLSGIVLIAAFLIAIIFTNSGINRRIRELGTLKAIGWPSRRIVGQIMGESIVSGVLGGLVGVSLGFIAIAAVNHFAPSLTASVSHFGNFSRGPQDIGMMPGSGMFPGRDRPAEAATSMPLHASVSTAILFLGIGISLIGGLVAGLFGGLRVTRLSPANALRSVA
jgi:ABC-type antimicrobial peptide transport system permease subunit